MMILWILLALLTALVAIALLYPLSRRPVDADAEAAGEVEVYRDQMTELERDKAQGLISAGEAEYARAEIGRRLLAAADRAEKSKASEKARPTVLRQFAMAVVTIAPPAIGLCLYIMLGSPGLPDQPLEARLENPGDDMALLVAKAERHLAQNPNDGAGWDILAPIYHRTGRLDDAEMAYRNAIRLQGGNPARLSGLGETLVAKNDGIVTEDARVAFAEAARLQPDDVRSRFYVALSFEQSGKAEEARRAFEEIAKASPADAPWLPMINERIVKNGGTASSAPSAAPPVMTLGGPTQEDVAAAQDMSQDDRQAMVRGMVDSLAAKMEAEPGNLEGWLRLVRSYMVLGERDKAEAALKSGLAHFPADGNEGRQLMALAGEMGLAADSAAPAGAGQ